MCCLLPVKVVVHVAETVQVVPWQRVISQLSEILCPQILSPITCHSVLTWETKMCHLRYGIEKSAIYMRNAFSKSGKSFIYAYIYCPHNMSTFPFHLCSLTVVTTFSLWPVSTNLQHICCVMKCEKTGTCMCTKVPCSGTNIIICIL